MCSGGRGNRHPDSVMFYTTAIYDGRSLFYSGKSDAYQAQKIG